MDPSKKDTAATGRYKKIYNLFIEGDFEKAIKEKETGRQPVWYQLLESAIIVYRICLLYP